MDYPWADEDYASTGIADGVSFFPVDALRKDPSLWEVFRKAITDSKEP